MCLCEVETYLIRLYQMRPQRINRNKPFLSIVMPMDYRFRLLGTIGLTLVGLALAGPLLPNLPTSSMQADWFWSHKVDPQQQFDVVFIGDSRIYRGISPDDFAQTFAPNTSIRVFNFGFLSAGLDTAFIQAGARLLDPDATCPIVVLGITTSALADENLVNAHFWQEYRRSPWVRWQRQHLNPSLSYFDPTSPEVLYQHLTGQQVGYYQDHQTNGWIASDKHPRQVWENDEHVRRTYPNTLFSQGLRQRLLDQVATWQTQGIQVVAFRPPAAPNLEALEMVPSYFPETALKAQLEGLGALWLELPDRTKYETYDGNHLVASSARQLSKDLGVLLRQALQPKTVVFRLQQDFEPEGMAFLYPAQDSTAPQGPQVQRLVTTAFSHTLEAPLNAQQSLGIEVEGWVRFETSPDSAQQPVLVLSIQDSSTTHLWKGQLVREQVLEPTSWSHIHLKVAYTPTQTGCTVRAYVWNPSPGVPMLIDGLLLKSWD